MARRSEGVVAKSARYEVGGMHEPAAGTPSPMSF